MVERELYDFIVREALPGSGIDEDSFWTTADTVVHDMAPRVREVLERRGHLQSAIDAYHRGRPSGNVDQDSYEAFLDEIGYLVEQPEAFVVTTPGVDVEVSELSAPQLVVPLLNARFAINAANARWGSLYDALYGSDVIPHVGDLVPGDHYNEARGAAVIAKGRSFLDTSFPLLGGLHADARSYAVDPSGLFVLVGDEPGSVLRLADPDQFLGYRGDPVSPTAVVLRRHGLHVELQIDRADPIGSTDRAGVCDLLLESAATTIMDLEDSVAAVDAADKVIGYRNWLGLMRGTLSVPLIKDGESIIRTLNPDRAWTGIDGLSHVLRARAVLFVRHVGHHMTTDAILDRAGNEVPEGIVDALVTAVAAAHDIWGDGVISNSRTGSMYVVKPKMHGPDEVALACEIFARVEEGLGFDPLTIKIGIMDEERRTSANLASCIHAARDRIAFINTGFLDRTGDEIHTSMQAGPMARKSDMRGQAWFDAYESSNVDVGLDCGLGGRAQIGKGMWAAPDNMSDMLATKIEHPQSGASCAWVPSPTAATLHAMHYHQVDVRQRQRQIARRAPVSRSSLLSIPRGEPDEWTMTERQAELDNNLQSLLGYVVRWIDSGIGCSKVADLSGVQLMEDRATCRISAQHVANWLEHGVVTERQVEDALQRMAAVVDEQNGHDPNYRPMAPGFDDQAFLAARELVLSGTLQASGYTEAILHRRRRKQKLL